MSDYEGVKAAAKGNPVIKWAKKNPGKSAAILGGAILLVVLFKPKEQPGDPEGNGIVSADGEAGAVGGVDYGGDIAALYTELEGLYGALGAMSDENAAQLESLTGWVNETMGQFGNDIASQIDGLYGQLDGFAMQQAPMNPYPTANPYQQVHPLTGQPLTGISSALSTGIKRLDLNIPEPETFSIRSRMDQVGDRWGQITAANGGTPNFEAMDLHAENLLSAARIGGKFNEDSGTYTWLTQPVTSFRSDLVLTGDNIQDTAKAQIAAIGEQWGAADAATREILHARAESIAKSAGGTYNPSTGTYTWA